MIKIQLKSNNPLIKKKSIISFIIITCIILTTSCNYKEINNMPMVTALAIDKVEDEFVITAKVIVPLGGSEGGTNDQIFIQSKGRTIFDAIRDIIMKEGEKPFWGQLEFVIINEKISNNGIEEVIDFFIRDDEVREDIWLLISEKEKKSEEIMLDTLSDKRVQFYISDALQNVNNVSKYNEVNLNDFVNSLMSKGKEEVLPFLLSEESLGQKRVLVNGGVIFKDGKSIGRLDGMDIKNYRLIINREKGGIRIIDYKDMDLEAQVSFDVSDSKSKIKIEKKDQTYVVIVDVTVIGVVGEISNNKINLLDIKYRDKFIETVEKQIEIELETFINKIQKEYGSDIFGFGEHFKDRYPKEFKTMEEDWNEVFASLPVSVSVKVAMKGSALVKQPLKEGE